MNKTENIQMSTLRFIHNDYTSDYETLVNKPNKCTMEVRRLRVLALEVSRSVNKLNPIYMQRLFEKKVNSKRYKDDVLGHHIWNMLPAESKRETSYRKIKAQINKWFGSKCNCSACKYVAN